MHAELITLVGVALFAYLLGSIPTALWIGYLRTGKDIRSIGSGNVGATNAARMMGPVMALLVFLLDALKGTAVMYLAVTWIPQLGYGVAAIAACVLLGHRYPILAGFRGGKGASTALGVLAVLEWHLALLTALCFAGVLVVSRVSSVATLASSLIALLVSVVAGVAGWIPGPVVVTVAVCTVFLWFSHRDNLKRLARREEPPVV